MTITAIITVEFRGKEVVNAHGEFRKTGKRPPSREQLRDILLTTITAVNSLSNTLPPDDRSEQIPNPAVN